SAREAFRIGPEGVHCEYYHHSDASPLILFLPGIGTYSELYAELLASVSARGFNVVGVDPRGHGYSDGRRGEYTVDQTVCDLERVVSALLPRSNGKVGVYGYSIGAMLAVALAECDARIGSVLCGTLLLTEVPPDMLHQAGWFWTWGSAQLFPSLRLPLRSFIDFDTLLAGNPAGEAINDDHRVVFDYPLSTLSSLFTHRAGVASQQYDFKAGIIQGEHDEVLSVEYTRRVLEALVHPFEWIRVPGEGHMIPWDNPEQLTVLVCDWFQRTLD
ncbi:MAG: alpha/beta hydrolase, partial [Oceanospirillales bacterium]|nr:alpha/beta hydrolase [Oceanospirillales bacterium]